MENTIKKIVWMCLIAIPFVVLYVASGQGLDPLASGTNGLYFPFISGKNLFFRFFVEIAFAGWVILFLSDAKYRFSLKKSPLSIAFAIFIAILFIADIFGVDTNKSMWSNFERMEGFAAHIHFFMYFIVLVAMLHTLKEWQTMFKIFIASNIAVLTYAYCQLLGAKGFIFSTVFPTLAVWFSTRFPIHQSETRLDSTIGNSAYFAIYCLLFAFISALLWSQSQNPRKAWLYPTLIVLNLIGLFYSGTRGTMIGFVVGVLVMIALQVFNWVDSKKEMVLLISSTILYAIYISVGLFINNDVLQYFSKISYVFAVVLLIVSISIFIRFKDNLRRLGSGVFIVIVSAVLLFQGIKTTDFVTGSPTLFRLASISPTEITSASRINIWKISYEAWLERPILGYGQDNFDYIYARKFVPEKMWNLEPWYDRSHDVFFDWLVAAGILGLVSYLSLYGVTLWLMWRKENDMPAIEKSILSGAIAGYFVHNIFVFDNLTSYILFFVLLAYIVVRTQDDDAKRHGDPIANKEQMKLLWIPVIGIVLFIVIYYVNYRPLLVNKLLIQAMSINQLSQRMFLGDALKIQLDSFKKTLALNTLGSKEAREQFVQVSGQMSRITIPDSAAQADRQVITQSINELVGTVRSEIESSYERYKNDVRMLSIYGSFYIAIGDGLSAEKILSQVRILAPKKQITMFDLVKAYLLQTKYTQAYELSKEVYDYAPAYPDAGKWYMLSAAYAGKFKEARVHILNSNKTIQFDGDVLNVLVNTGQISLAVELLNELKKSNPDYSAQVDTYINQILAPKK